MSDLSVKISLDASSYSSGIKKASDATKEYTNQISKVTQGLPNARREYSQTLRAVSNMTVALRQMTSEQRKSAEGMALARSLEEAKQRAGQLKDAIVDVNDEIKYLSSDTKTLDAMNQGFQVVGGTLSSIASITGLVTGENEKLKKAIMAFTTVQSVANTLTAIGNALRRQSALVKGIETLQTKAGTLATKLETAAKSKNIVVTKAATIAQKALNLAMKANPIGIMITGLTALIALFADFSDGAEDAADSMGELEDASNDLSTAEGRQAEYSEVLSQKTAELLTNYESLRIRWLSCSSEMERQQFLKSMGDNFMILGHRITDTNGAMDMLIKKAPQVRQAYMLIASIEAAQDVYKKMMENSLQSMVGNLPVYEQITSATPFKAVTNSNGGLDLPQNLKEMGFTREDARLSYTSGSSGEWTLLPNAVTRYNKMMEKRADDAIKKMSSVFNQVQEKAGNYLTMFIENQTDAFNKLGLGTYEEYMANTSSSNTPSSSSHSSNRSYNRPRSSSNTISRQSEPKAVRVTNDLKEKIKEQKTELQQLKEQRDELENYLKRTDIDPIERKEKQAKLDELKDEILRRETWTDDHEYIIDMPLDSFVLMPTGDFRVDKAEMQKKYEEWVNGMDFSAAKPLDIKTRFTADEYKKFENKKLINEDSTSGISRVQEWFDAGLLGREKAQELIDAFNAERQLWNLEPIEIELKTDKLKSDMATAGNIVNSLSSSIATAFDAFNSYDKSKRDDNKDNKGMMVGKIIAQAVATLALSFAQAMSGSKTIWTWIAGGITGMATLLTMAAQINNLKGYAEGGIVGGHSYYGDKILARLNSGELIISQKQQKRLYNQLYGGGIMYNNQLYGNVTIKGSDLNIALTNYDKKTNKMR